MVHTSFGSNDDNNVRFASGGPPLETSVVRILVVDDYLPWRRFLCSALQKQPRFKVVEEGADGIEAIQKAQECELDLILLDVGLPKLNGIEAARRIREVGTATAILFVSENRAPEIVEEAFRSGAMGYLVKSDAGSGLLPAIEAVLDGRPFVSRSLFPVMCSDSSTHSIFAGRTQSAVDPYQTYTQLLR